MARPSRHLRTLSPSPSPGATASPAPRGRPQRALALGLVALLVLLLGFALACAQRSSAPVEAAHTAALERAEAALAVGEFDAARAGFDEVTRQASEELRGWEGLAQTALAQGEDSAALGAFRERAVRTQEPLRPGLSRGRCGAAARLAEAELSRAEFGPLEQRLESAGLGACSQVQQSDLRLRFHLAAASTGGSEAEEHYRRALQLEAGHERASLGLAALLASTGRSDAALSSLSVALELHPRSRALVEATVDLLTTPAGGVD